jgi:hypothetical protein
VTGWMGNTVELKSDGSREAQIQIDEASGPVYLLWKHPPASALMAPIEEWGRVH